MFFLCLVASGCGIPPADGPADTYELDLPVLPPSKISGAVIFFVDALNASIFEEMLTAGELPAIQEYFVDRGLYCPRAVANTPSVTMANLTSFVTGLFPGHHGVTGVNWFDRNRLIWRDYTTIRQKNTLDGDYTAANIYEQFPDRTTFSLFFQPHRGATKFAENWTSAGPPFFFGWYEYVDRLTLYRFNIVADVAARRGRWPAVTIAYLLEPDFRAYENGVSAPAYRQAIRNVDLHIGRVLGDIKAAGLLDGLHIVLVSDHGMLDVTGHLNMADFLRTQIGLNVARDRLWERTPFESRLDYYRKYPVVLYGSGDRYAAICLRRPIRSDDGAVSGYESWPVRPRMDDLRAYPAADGDVDLPVVLAARPEVDAVAYSAQFGRVRVRTARGEVEFHQTNRDGAITYRLVEGEDPLGWRGEVDDELLDSVSASPRDWLTATAETNYPDLPAQILAYFRAPRAGDIAVFAAPGWDFNTVNRAGHGGLSPQDMHVPLLIAGPGIDRMRLPIARTADVMPTLLELLGRPVPANLDGRPLIPTKSRAMTVEQSNSENTSASE